MLIPKTFKVGKHTYTVHQNYRLRPGTYGQVYFGVKTVLLAPNHKPDTFWHEVTHAILYEMGDPLYADEDFVNKFSKRLTQAINTARF